MGTSTSYRAPSTPRWSAFVASLAGDAPLDRVRSELFNAGNEWQDALASAAVASFAGAVERLFGEMPQRLRTAESPTVAVSVALAEARAASHEAGFSPATPVAERALARLLLGTLAGAEAPSVAADTWIANRGPDTHVAVGRYLGEVLRQYAQHVTEREAGRLAERGVGASATATLARDLATSAESISALVATTGGPEESGDVRWQRWVAAAFESGRAIPGRRQ
jgi:hypothetical protein